MFNIYAIVLRLFHCLYAIYLSLSSLWQQHHRRQPRSLLSPRTRLPKHLAVVIVISPDFSQESAKGATIDTVSNVAQWCRQLGVSKLTVYEEHGLLTQCEEDIRSRVTPDSLDCASSESEAEYRPLTPPPSDYSESRPLSPSHSSSLIPMTSIAISSPSLEDRTSHSEGLRRRGFSVDDKRIRNPLQLCLISREASKGALAAVATSLAQQKAFKNRKAARSGRPEDFSLSVEALESILENEDGLSPPDFMIVHSLGAEGPTRKTPLELHGFPPWHIRLTEIFTSRVHETRWITRSTKPSAYPLTEDTLCEALDEFSGAEMRFGK